MTKLTAVTITARGRRYYYFIMLPYENGKAMMDSRAVSQLLTWIGLARGETYSIG